MPEKKKTAILTGASRGIGAGLVGAFLKEGYIVVAALALTLPLQSQQSAIGDSREASGSVRQPASAASKQAQRVDQDPNAVKKRIARPAEKSPMDPSTIGLDAGPPAVPSSSPGTQTLNRLHRLRAGRAQPPTVTTP